MLSKATLINNSTMDTCPSSTWVAFHQSPTTYLWSPLDLHQPQPERKKGTLGGAQNPILSHYMEKRKTKQGLPT